MSDEDALLAAIAAHPDEDTPRLAFADWLDENDRPLRAEFIRLQCGLKHTATLPRAEQRKVAERLRSLIENHRRDLIGPLGGDLTAFDVTFDRGFLSELRITALQFVLGPRAFGALRPVPRVRIRNLTRAQFDRFVRCPEAACVVSVATVDLGPSNGPVFAACPHLRQLEALQWVARGVNNGLGNTGLEALAFADELAALVNLDVQNNEISDVGVERLVASPLWRRLTHLNLAYNALTGESANHLANAPDDHIAYLGLQGVNFGAPGRRRLARRFGDRVQF